MKSVKKRRLRSWVVILIFLIFVFIFIYSGIKVILWKINTNKNNNIIEEIISKNIVINEDDVNKYIVNFKSLKIQNDDTIAYLKVNNTNINYIVVKGSDNSYYLTHNFNKEYNVAGWIFADYKNKYDGRDKNLIIYGHNTFDGSMFGTLKNILDEKWYNNSDNLIIDLVTEKGFYQYKVFSIYTIKKEDYYIKTSFKDDADFLKFLNALKERSKINFYEDISNIKQILTLSTCTIDGESRVVLHAKLIES